MVHLINLDMQGVEKPQTHVIYLDDEKLEYSSKSSKRKRSKSSRSKTFIDSLDSDDSIKWWTIIHSTNKTNSTNITVNNCTDPNVTKCFETDRSIISPSEIKSNALSALSSAQKFDFSFWLVLWVASILGVWWAAI